MMYDRIRQQPFDLSLLLCTTVLVSFGLAAIYSACNGVGIMTNFHKQLIWLGISLVAMMIVMFLPYRFFQDWAYTLYGLSLLALVAVLIIGRKVSGSLSWFQVAGASIQPSEFAKLTTIMALARYLSHRDTNIRSLKGFATAIGIVLLPVALIMLQPDTGTALTYLTFIVPMIVLAGSTRKALVTTPYKPKLPSALAVFSAKGFCRALKHSCASFLRSGRTLSFASSAKSLALLAVLLCC